MAVFSPLFTIELTDAMAATDVTTITNPGQAFELVSVDVSGTDTGVATIRKNTGAGATAAVASQLATGDTCILTVANTSFAATDDIHITCATAALDRISLVCRALTANSPTWSNTTPA